MATTTPNLGLTLPTGVENVSRQIINENMQAIDTQLGDYPSKVNTVTIYNGTEIATAKNGATINNNGAYSRAMKRSGWVFLKLRIECPSISSGQSIVVAQVIDTLKIASGIYYYKVYNEWSTSIAGTMNIRETGEIEARDDCSGKDLTVVISYPAAIE